MMIILRSSADRGVSQNQWLTSRHSFSFGSYVDRKYMNYGVLEVINDDIIKPNYGFDFHPHKNMEIITYIIEGQLKHQDSLGNGSIISAGEIQIMSAGTGITHSEYNASSIDDLKLLQIWISPNQMNLPPRYEQKQIPLAATQEKLTMIVSPQGLNGAVKIFQDVNIYILSLQKLENYLYQIPNQRKAWLQIIKGKCQLANYSLSQGDAVSVESSSNFEIIAKENCEIMIFDLP